MKSSTLRIVVPVALIAIVALAFAFRGTLGTLSAFGIGGLMLMCPLGALAAMIATWSLIPRAIVSVLVAAALVLVLGKAFCGWVCPVPVVKKLRGLFSKRESKSAKAEAEKLEGDAAAGEGAGAAAAGATAAVGAAAASVKAATSVEPAKAAAPLTAEEQTMLKKGCSPKEALRGQGLDSRHFILGGSLLSAALFGFPVFCLVCPVGLTFASIFLIMALFGQGDVSWAVVVAPVLLLVEVVFFRKWCHKLCPLSAMMSLVAKANRTFVPVINDEKCLETAKGVSCGRCGAACGEGIDLRHPELSTAAMNECTRCRACSDVCPGKAITFPLLAPSAAKAKSTAVDSLPELDDDEPSVAL